MATVTPRVRTSFLDPAVLARIDNLQLLARTVVEGFMQGIHRSPYLGMSMDFAEHRPYMPGDDIRRIDWRLYARTDRFYIKQFEAETNADVGFLLDTSASMGYGSGEVTKLDYGRFLTACLAWFSAGQKDRVGLYAFDNDMVEHVRPSAAHLDKVLHALARVKAERQGAWDRPLARVANTFRRRGILVVVSDFYDDPGRNRRRARFLPRPGPRRGGLSRARRRGDRLPLHPGLQLPGPGDAADPPGEAGEVRRRLPEADSRPHRRARQALRQAWGRTRPPQHRRTA